MAGKRQVVVPGGIRKVIQTGGPTSSPGTTIAELGATTVSLAQLKVLLGITTPAAGSSGGSSAPAVLIPGAGLLGGGSLLGAVPLYLQFPIPPVVWNDALLPDDFVGGASSGNGNPGVKVTDGINTVNAAASITFSGATVSGSTPNATVTVSGGGALTKLSETILSSTASSVTFSSISGAYRSLILRVVAATNAGAANSVWTLNGDTGANYDWQQFLFGATSANETHSAQTSFSVGAPGNGGAALPWIANITIPNYAATVFNKGGTGNYVRNDSLGTEYGGVVGFQWRNTAAVTSITIAAGGGSFVTGSTFSLYGES